MCRKIYQQVTGIMICFAMLLSLAARSTAIAGPPVDVRLMRVLRGKNEIARATALNLLRDDVAARIRVMDDLVSALHHHSQLAQKSDKLNSAVGDIASVLVLIDRPQAKQAVIDLLDSKFTPLAMTAAHILGKHKATEALEALKKQTERDEFRDSYGFRFNLVRSILLLEDKEAYQYLAELSAELDGQLKYQLVTNLEKAGVDLSAATKTQELPADKPDDNDDLVGILAGSKKNFGSSVDPIKLNKNEYYGIPIYAKRMLFVIDCSGSMKEMTLSGTRLSSAKRELISAINGLDSTCEFGILFFSDSVHEWREGLQSASDENKIAAVKFVRRLAAGKTTNTYGALHRSMEFDDQLETVFMLTDGKPTCGEVTNPTVILNHMLLRNETRHLTFNTIGIAVSGQTELFLRAIAERSNGEYRLAF